MINDILLRLHIFKKNMGTTFLLHVSLYLDGQAYFNDFYVSIPEDSIMVEIEEDVIDSTRGVTCG